MGRPPLGKTAMTGAERTRQYRERLKAAQPPKPDSGSKIDLDAVLALQREVERLTAERDSALQANAGLRGALDKASACFAKADANIAKLEAALKDGLDDSAVASLQVEVERLKAENDELRKAAREAAEPGRLERQVRELQATIVRLQAELASRTPPLPRSPEEWAAAKLKASEERKARRAALNAARAAEQPEQPEQPELRERLAELERQLKAARTRIKNLTAEARYAWETTKGKPAAAISKAQLRELQKVFHPDREAKVSEARKRQLTEAFQIFNAIRFQVRD